MSAFWRKLLGTIGIAVVETYLEKHPALVPVINSGEQELIALRQAIRDKNLVAAEVAATGIGSAWGQLISELKK